MSPKFEREARILILAPTGRDAKLIAETLLTDRLHAVVCPDAEALLTALAEGAAGAILSEESLSPAAVTNLADWVSAQSPWSDLPFVVLTARGTPRPSTTRRARELETLGNVTFLERPVRPETVRTAMRAAYRARMRQYQMRDRQETLARLNADLEQFAHSASHDLKEPIRNIAIFSQLLAENYENVFDEEGKDFLQLIISGARQIEILVNDLLLYTQATNVEAGSAEVTSAEKPLESALVSLREAIRENSATVTFGPLPEIAIRPVHLQQIFQNLIENAIKYRRDIPQIHISAAHERGECIFSVQDNGIGFDPIYKQQVFGIFKRLHTSRQYAGTGMGLAICQRIVERYGGRIWAESTPGEGSVFSFALPESENSVRN